MSTEVEDNDLTHRIPEGILWYLHIIHTSYIKLSGCICNYMKELEISKIL